MNKREFLETLKEALSEEMPASLVRENVQYYSQYIDGEVEKGCTEKEAVAKLGAPRLIAKTLLEAFETTGQTYGSDGNQTAYQDKYGRQNRSEGDYGDWASESIKNHIKFSKQAKIHLIIGILIAVCVIVLIVSLISALLPIVLPVFAVLLALSYLQKKL